MVRYLTHDADERALVTDVGIFPLVPDSLIRLDDSWSGRLPMENGCQMALHLEDNGQAWLMLVYQTDDEDNWYCQIKGGKIITKRAPAWVGNWMWTHDVIGYDDVMMMLKQIGRLEVVHE